MDIEGAAQVSPMLSAQHTENTQEMKAVKTVKDSITFPILVSYKHMEVGL